MTTSAISRLRPGQALQIAFPSFTARLDILSAERLVVAVVAGENAGFSDTVDYELTAVREDILLLSWQEHIGSTIVHVLDLTANAAHSAVTPDKGGFMRLRGRIEFYP